MFYIYWFSRTNDRNPASHSHKISLSTNEDGHPPEKQHFSLTLEIQDFLSIQASWPAQIITITQQVSAGRNEYSGIPVNHERWQPHCLYSQWLLVLFSTRAGDLYYDAVSDRNVIYLPFR